MNVDRAGRQGRWAVAGVFFVNGFLTGSWAPQIPVFLQRLEITEFTLGLLILAFGLGALSAMPWSSYLMTRHGSRTVVRGFAATGAFGLLLVALAPNVPVAAVALYLFGGMIGAMDVAMNANAVAVERKLAKAVMSSSHGFWSLGGFAGGGLGGLAIENFGHLAHAAAVTVVSLGVLAMALPALLQDSPAPAGERTKFSLAANPLVYLIGLVALFGMMSEGAVLDWAALYLRQELGSDIATAGFAFAAFSGTMALMRFGGDAVRNRFGAVATVRASALLAASGMLVASLATSPWLAIAAFGWAGLGIANIVPIAFSAAGNQKGLSAGVGLGTVTIMGYSGLLVAPSAIGFVAERIGFSPVFMAAAVLLMIVCLFGALVESADFDAGAGSGG